LASGLQSLKLFLDELNFGAGDHTKKLCILQEFLDWAKPRLAGEDEIFLRDIIETWSFAARSNDEGVMAAVVVVLGLILLIASKSLQFLPYGQGICQTLLQEEQQKLIARHLHSEASKAFLISPTIRLLNEVVCLDGGAYARRIFRARKFTFASLGRNLKITVEGHAEDPKRPFVRTTAVRFFLSCLRLLDSESKTELLKMKEVTPRLTLMLKTDPPYLVREILETIGKHVAEDSKVPREVKSKFFDLQFLGRIVDLYQYHGDDADAVSNTAHDLLMLISTTPELGILRSDTGLYPLGLLDRLERELSRSENISIDRIAWIGKFTQELPVVNALLAEFIKKLRPWTFIKHNDLLVAILRAAPELVAHYFQSLKDFTFDYKLTMTWIGYCAVLFNIMELPIPPFFGRKGEYAAVPPPTAIVLNNILPLPINQKSLIRCLSTDSSKSNLVSFFAIRLLIMALQKLNQALKMHREAASGNPVWPEASQRLIDELCQRIPDMKHVAAIYKAIPEDSILHREAVSRLLLLYFEVVPQMAFSANFDISPFLLRALGRLNDGGIAARDKALIGMELDNLLTIAGYSPGMRWFHSVDARQASTFTTLLRTLIEAPKNISPTKLQGVLEFVAQEHQLVLKDTGLKPMMRSFQVLQKQYPALDLEAVWSFLDKCISRCANGSLKYLEQMQDSLKYLEQMEDSLKDVGLDDFGRGRKPCIDVSLVTITMVEQLPFATTTGNEKDHSALAKFLSAYMGASTLVLEHGSLLDVLCQKMAETFETNTNAALDLDIPDDLVMMLSPRGQTQNDWQPSMEASRQASSEEPTEMNPASLHTLLDVPMPSEAKNSALTKWVSKSVDDLIEEDYIISLTRLLASEETSIRKEAVTNIVKVAAKIRESSHDDKEQVWLLLSEIAESSREQVGEGPVPSAFIVFTVNALDIIKNPLHVLYPKVNRFLTWRPKWPGGSIPMAEEILQGEPSEDDKYYAELSWLLEYLVDCLCTKEDLAAFRRRRIFESLFVLGSNPYIRSNLRTRIYRILYRATCIDEGSTTLTTRFGVVSWLESQMMSCGDENERKLLKALMRRVWETCDQAHVTNWSRGGVGEKMVSGSGSV
jgi:nucleolar pre-ribosomal-associated protein 1